MLDVPVDGVHRADIAQNVKAAVNGIDQRGVQREPGAFVIGIPALPFGLCHVPGAVEGRVAHRNGAVAVRQVDALHHEGGRHVPVHIVRGGDACQQRAFVIPHGDLQRLFVYMDLGGTCVRAQLVKLPVAEEYRQTQDDQQQ